MKNKNHFYATLDCIISSLYIFVLGACVALLTSSLFAAYDTYDPMVVESKPIVEMTIERPTEPEETIVRTSMIDILKEQVEAIEFPDVTIPSATEVATEPEPTEPEIVYYDVGLSTDLQTYIFELCELRGIDPAIVIAMIYRESGFNSGAVGDNGIYGYSYGLMQIIPDYNGARMNELGCYDLFDPYQNVAVGIDCFADYVDMSGSVEWALMAYNGGPGHANSMWSSGLTSNYVWSVLSYADSIRNN